MKLTILFFLVGSLICACQSAPHWTLEDEDLMEDSHVVESTVREVRALKDSDTAPANFHKSYDSGDKGDKGYSRQVSDKGKKGYQAFDSFHKKGGDSYGYEKHDSFGIEGKKGSNKKADGKSAKYQVEDESEYDGDEDGSYEESSDDGAGDYDESSQNDEESDDNDGGEEAAVAVSGYDEADAVNYDTPSGYAYGAGNEYDFK